MLTYKLYKTGMSQTVNAAMVENEDGSITSFFFVPETAIYQQLKDQIPADEAQLEDADGNLMTPEEAKAFVATLP